RLHGGFGARRAAAALALAVEEPPHVRQERDEFAVVARLELLGRAAEVLLELAPRVLALALLEQLPRLLDLRAFADRHELQRPEQDLAEVAHDLRHEATLRARSG